MKYPINTTAKTVIYEDKNLTVETIPLDHRCPCSGFLIKEKNQPPHIDKAACDSYGIPPKELRFIKEGKDYVMPDGKVIPKAALTTSGEKGRSYAYCCDTAPVLSLKEQLKDITLLCHEATYTSNDYEDSAMRGHSTAADAAHMAELYGANKLLIIHFSMYDREENQLLNEACAIIPDTLLAEELLKVKIE